ncbi:hypothetical protein AJ79_04864 [Helicocarpus griseus UAMH5409]|uniref:Uncharacterized protein n=1 Tax=Helicocarpus griseus UAMH5409 TaxID=1447875 RepID=A0A2B7XRB5_9EURO|nr:hypothetical protein AJ79_04864 [Helicocarpus griseus UAMH5409]
MKIFTIALTAIGLISRITAAVDSYEDIIVCEGVDVGSNRHFNALKPKHISQVVRDFCTKYRNTENLADGQLRKDDFLFETSNRGRNRVSLSFRRYQRLNDGPVKWDTELCIYLFGKAIECPQKEPGKGPLTRWGGATAIRSYGKDRRSAWSAQIAPSHAGWPGSG